MRSCGPAAARPTATEPTDAAVGHLLRSLPDLTIVERLGDGYCVTDPINYRTQVLEPPATLVVWNPLEEFVWGERGGQQLAMRVAGEVFDLPTPREFDQVFDADSGTLTRGRRARPTSVAPAFRVDLSEGVFHVTSEGRIGRNDEPVIELEGNIDHVYLDWPVVVVLTSTHVTTLLVRSFGDDRGDDAQILWRHALV